MGKRERSKGRRAWTGYQGAITLREESSGKNQLRGCTNNAKSILKRQHLQKLALWAGGEVSIPSLGAFFGHRLAACAEAMGTPLDPSLFPCQICDSILQPGYNCTVQIKKNHAKVRSCHKKLNVPTKNNVVYTCHFCSQWNLKRGTPKGHMKEIYALKPKLASELKPFRSTEWKSASLRKCIESRQEINEMEEITPLIKMNISESKSDRGEIALENSPVTPMVKTCNVLLEGKGNRIKRSGSGSSKPGGQESNYATIDAEKTASSSSKRRRKSWSSLKEIAESCEQEHTRHITNLMIPLYL